MMKTTLSSPRYYKNAVPDSQMWGLAVFHCIIIAVFWIDWVNTQTENALWWVFFTTFWHLTEQMIKKAEKKSD